ncbi:hypothetical protein G647_01466 [Cladophialophora carrionii CBS 160.54]|uniref:GH16 domain-containing protein n=1 Tax=Cladophialophora carrionii CBS 160.54 TaxID=1279043 RepID=V9DRT1_9EURO|nr:uncharacterized protein G647_01466 [Cladophialophora carrionii CBS 160.54]ETI29013.1 hypothetical protein G647_01466 [Cladophialophora carrionii CBS 160.54]
MPSPSLFLGSSTTLVSALLLLSSSAAATSDAYYALDTDYSGRDFFDGFSFFTDADPTHGFVTYVDEATALADGLINTRGGSAQIKVDSTHKYNGSAPYSGINGVGRPSVRIESIDSWTHGLFIADIKHMPTTTDSSGCGVWPAFWTLGSGTWPYNGEIDIIEGANNQANDLTSTHVAGSCVISQNPSEMTGTSNGNDCQYNVATGANAQGCGAFSKSSVSYGAGFNSNKGGVYAMEWKSDAIKVWFFPRGSIPSDISSGNPEPSGWGLPDSIFNGPGCDIDANFADNRFIFDTTFCGDFGDATWQGGGCAAIESQSQCSVFVGDHPEQFTEAYWDVSYVRVYQSKPVTGRTSSSTTSTTTTSSSSSTRTISHATTSEASTTESTTLPYTHSHTFGGQPGTTSAPATATTTWYTTSASPSPSTTSPYIHTTASSPGASSETTWAHSPSSSSSSSESPATTPGGSWEGTTSSFDWQDWESSTKPADPVTTSLTTSSINWADWELSMSSTSTPADPVTTSSTFSWADWEVSASSTSKPNDPVTTSSSSSFNWADWEVFTSSTSKPNDPATTSAFTWSDWSSDTSVAPISTATWSDWNSDTSLAPISTATSAWGSPDGKPSSPVAAASAGSSTWVSPSVTIATTVTVAPVASSAWVAAASATPVAPYSVLSDGTGSAGTTTSPWVAAYTGAAGRTGLNGLALLGAGAVAFGVLAL